MCRQTDGHPRLYGGTEDGGGGFIRQELGLRSARMAWLEEPASVLLPWLPFAQTLFAEARSCMVMLFSVAITTCTLPVCGRGLLAQTGFIRHPETHHIRSTNKDRSQWSSSPAMDGQQRQRQQSLMTIVSPIHSDKIFSATSYLGGKK